MGAFIRVRRLTHSANWQPKEILHATLMWLYPYKGPRVFNSRHHQWLFWPFRFYQARSHSLRPSPSNNSKSEIVPKARRRTERKEFLFGGVSGRRESNPSSSREAHNCLRFTIRRLTHSANCSQKRSCMPH